MRLTLEKTKKCSIPKDEDGGFVIIKALSQEELAQIQSKSSEVAIATGDDIKISVDDVKRINLTAHACLTGWGNLFDEKGTEIKFNKANVNKVAQCSVRVESKPTRFLQWVDDCHTAFLAEIEEGMKEASKN